MIESDLDGVGILFYPPSKLTHEQAVHIAKEIHKGVILVFPTQTDTHGNLLWNFRMEGGDPKQVTVKYSSEVDEPLVLL